jgi:hypothetical protein
MIVDVYKKLQVIGKVAPIFLGVMRFRGTEFQREVGARPAVEHYRGARVRYPAPSKAQPPRAGRRPSSLEGSGGCGAGAQSREGLGSQIDLLLERLLATVH